MLLRNTLLLVTALSAQAIAAEPKQVSVNTAAETNSTLAALVPNLMSKFDPHNPGLITSLESWEAWISASTHNTMIDYWHYTGDCTYADQTSKGIISQAGDSNDFDAISPGNDDSLWWGLTCISAAEHDFPLPKNTERNWLCLAKNVFKTVISRWQPDMCGPGKGGLGWQKDTTNDGYGYKNAITQGLAFQLAARLAAFTKEQEYETWATKLFEASLQPGLINATTHQVSDGVHAPDCTDVGDDRWSYNVAVFLYGAAVMHKYKTSPLHSSTTSTATTTSIAPSLPSNSSDSMPSYQDPSSTSAVDWLQHVQDFLSAARSDFTTPCPSPHILYEQRCEDSGTCNTDQQTFKSYLARWLGMTAVLIPETRASIMEVLDASANAALEVVNTSPDKAVASLEWSAGGKGYNESTVGMGAQLGVVEVVMQMGAVRRAWVG